MRPDIAQAIHDAAVSFPMPRLPRLHWEMLELFCNWKEFQNPFTDEGRTYMLLVAEALS